MKNINKLIDIYPDIAKELDVVQNKDLDVNTISVSSNKLVYWLCPKGHSYKMSVDKRTGKNKCGCPYCSNRRLLVGFNDLKTKYPDVALEWDYSKNDKNPENFVYGSSFKAFWKCKECEFGWKTSIRNRTSMLSKCPMCIRKENGLKRHIYALNRSGGISNELLIKEWDYDSNIGTPSDYTEGSAKKVSWICSKCNQKFIASINNRANGRGCPICSNKKVVKGINDLLTTHPQFSTEWDYVKNDILPDQITYGYGKKLWWKCINGHSYQAIVNHRTGINGTGCPICIKGKQTSFAEQAFYYYIKKVYPDAINSYKEIFNNGMELDIYIPSIKLGIEYDGEVWHKENNFERELKKYKICKKYHIKLLRLKEKRYENDILTADKILHIEKMYKKENLYKAIFFIMSDISPETNMWTIKTIDRWYTNLDVNLERDELDIRKYMSELSYNSLYDLYPGIAAEWNYNKNDNLTPRMVKPKSDIKVWWICPKCNNEYKSSISHRTEGTGCPKCGIKTNTFKRSKPVKMIDVDTHEVVKVFNSISEASREMNISAGNICAVLNGKRKHTKGYKWEYKK